MQIPDYARDSVGFFGDELSHLHLGWAFTEKVGYRIRLLTWLSKTIVARDGLKK